VVDNNSFIFKFIYPKDVHPNRNHFLKFLKFNINPYPRFINIFDQTFDQKFRKTW